MTVLPIVIVGDPALHRPTRPVRPDELGSEALRAFVADLFDTMAAAHGVGLAANQVGDERRVFVFDCPDGETGERRHGVVVNPELTTSTVPETMPDPEDDHEGCLSAPGESFPTGRAEWASVTGTDADGEPVTVAGRDFFARCLQHETDHLDGTMYLDRLVGRNKRAAKKAVRDLGWGVPGHSWVPGTVPDPFGHDE